MQGSDSLSQLNTDEGAAHPASLALPLVHSNPRFISSGRPENAISSVIIPIAAVIILS